MVLSSQRAIRLLIAVAAAWPAVARGQLALPDSRLTAAASGPAADSCDCGSLRDAGDEGVVWVGSTRPSRLEDLAALVAPILWFSPDEPLLRHGAVIPAPLPCDQRSDVPIVYYQAMHIRREPARVAAATDDGSQDLAHVRSLTLRFFFYYPHDMGLGSHPHDLEGADFTLHLDRLPSGCWQVRVTRAIGLAHGLFWYANTLDVRADTRFPLALLVEEGKHASCPDRNADGAFTPGYDVNVRINDAWGVRDVMGSGYLLAREYNASMTKRRSEGTRLLPPELPFRRCGPSSIESTTPHLGRYALRAATAMPRCPQHGPFGDALVKLLRGQQFGSYRDTPSVVSQETSARDIRVGLIPGASLRVDGGNLGGAIVFRGIDFKHGWLVPRVLLANGAAAELLVTPSASRWADWYVSAGMEDVGEERWKADFVSEFGLKFRVRTSGRARWATLGYSFGGLRLGVRTNGIKGIYNARFVVEIGAGVW